MELTHQVAQDAERTNVYCKLKAGRDAVKAERDTNGGVSFKECVRGGHVGGGRRAGAVVAHLRWKWRSPSTGRSDRGREVSEKPRKRLVQRLRVAAVNLSFIDKV